MAESCVPTGNQQFSVWTFWIRAYWLKKSELHAREPSYYLPVLPDLPAGWTDGRRCGRRFALPVHSIGLQSSSHGIGGATFPACAHSPNIDESLRTNPATVVG